MPRTHFICPDSVEIEIKDCLECCRMEERCVTPSTLNFFTIQRTWAGKISATQALNGMRLEYLKIVENYAESPQKLAFALLGTKHHKILESILMDNALQEEALEDEFGTGIPDDYYGEDLTDYKTWGSYKVAKVLGVKKNSEDVATGGVYKSGKNKGKPRTKKEYYYTIGKREALDATIQLNRYRILYERSGFPVKNMWIQVTVRDGGTHIAINRGIVKNIYMIKIKKISNHWLDKFYKIKQEILASAVKDNKMPPKCKPRERWDNRRCEDYCPVWLHCDHGIKIHANKEKK